MKLTKITLATVLGLSVITSANATGIPVVDGAAIAQNLANHIESIANMAKQLAEAKKQLEQLKQQYEAITGNKGFVDILNQAGMTSEMYGSLGTALGHKEFYAGNTNIDFAKKLETELNQRIAKIEDLSQRAQSAKDAKSMQELIANINLENNAIEVLKQKTDNFERVITAQKEVIREKADKEYLQANKERAALIKRSYQNNKKIEGKSKNFGDLLDKG